MVDEVIHNGETKRKAARWDWIQRVSSLGVYPCLAVVLVMWADWRDYARKQDAHETAHERIAEFMAPGARFTSKEGALIQKSVSDIYVEIAQVKLEIVAAELRVHEWTRSNFPPDDLKSDIREIKNLLQVLPVLEARIKSLEEKYGT